MNVCMYKYLYLVPEFFVLLVNNWGEGGEGAHAQHLRVLLNIFISVEERRTTKLI